MFVGPHAGSFLLTKSVDILCVHYKPKNSEETWREV